MKDGLKDTARYAHARKHGCWVAETFDEIPNGAMFMASDRGEAIFIKETDGYWTLNKNMMEDKSYPDGAADFLHTPEFYCMKGGPGYHD